jgi:hypothetical protein
MAKNPSTSKTSTSSTDQSPSQRVVINGRPATAMYLDNRGNPVALAKAYAANINFDDGETMFATFVDE